jgi:hypothetical protein
MQIRTESGAGRAAPWIVRPHGNLEQLDEGLWTVSGSIHVPVGEFPRRMSVVRLAVGRLLIYSAIAVDEATLQGLEALGTPAFLVVPNEHHREDALAWKQRYPGMQVVAPPGSREKIESRVPVDTTAPDLGDAAVSLMVVPGTRAHELALLVRRTGGSTLVVNDIIANIRDTRGFGGWLLELMGFAGDGPSVPGPVKTLMIKEKAALRQQLIEWAGREDLRRIVVSHGDIIDADPQGALHTLAASLS